VFQLQRDYDYTKVCTFDRDYPENVGRVTVERRTEKDRRQYKTRGAAERAAADRFGTASGWVVIEVK
jgi:hypothetical protein